MSKDDKKRDYTPAENVAANNVADETTATNVAAEEKTTKSRLPLSKKAIIGLSAAGVAVILGAGFTGAAIAEGIDHGVRGGEHSQIDGGRGGHEGRGGHDGQMGQKGQMGQNGQMPGGQQGQMGPNGQFVDPDPNDNDGPGTGVAPQGGTGVAPQAPTGTPQAQGAPNGFTRGS